jgi:hypothetical protein
VYLSVTAINQWHDVTYTWHRSIERSEGMKQSGKWSCNVSIEWCLTYLKRRDSLFFMNVDLWKLMLSLWNMLGSSCLHVYIINYDIVVTLCLCFLETEWIHCLLEYDCSDRTKIIECLLLHTMDGRTLSILNIFSG